MGVTFMSGYHRRQGDAPRRDRRGNGFLQKPFTPAQFRPESAQCSRSEGQVDALDYTALYMIVAIL
jgi:hypothetical protein